MVTGLNSLAERRSPFRAADLLLGRTMWLTDLLKLLAVCSSPYGVLSPLSIVVRLVNVFRMVRTLAMLRPVPLVLLDLLPETHLIVIITPLFRVPIFVGGSAIPVFSKEGS